MVGPSKTSVIGSRDLNLDPERYSNPIRAVDAYPSQNIRCDLNMDVSLVTARTPSDSIRKFLYVSLEGTRLTNGPMARDQDDIRGYFTEKVLVEISLTDGNLVQDKPTSTQIGGNYTDGTDQSINLGVFATDPTASVTFGHNTSASTSIDDFYVENISSDTQVNHNYKLGAVQGGKYDEVTDLVGSVFEAGKLHRIPPRASSSLDLSSKCLFQIDNNVEGTHTLWVKLTHTLVLVEKTFRPAEAAAGAAVPIAGWFAAAATGATELISHVTHTHGTTVEGLNAVLNVYRNNIVVARRTDIDFSK